MMLNHQAVTFSDRIRWQLHVAVLALVLSLVAFSPAYSDPQKSSAPPKWISDGDDHVCSAFDAFFAHQRKRYPTQDGTAFMWEDAEPWAGVQPAPSLSDGDPNYDAATKMGFILNGVRENEKVSQVFRADLFRDGSKRLVILTTTNNKFRSTAIMILRPSVNLNIQELQNNFDQDMTILGPDPKYVDLQIGAYFGLEPGAYEYIQNGMLDINNFNMDDPDLAWDSRTKHLIKYFLFWNTHSKYAAIQLHTRQIFGNWEPPNKSDFIFKGKSPDENIKLLKENDYIEYIVTGFNSHTKAYIFQGGVYFVMGWPVLPRNGKWFLYHISRDWKVEILCYR